MKNNAVGSFAVGIWFVSFGVKKIILVMDVYPEDFIIFDRARLNPGNSRDSLQF